MAMTHCPEGRKVSITLVTVTLHCISLFRPSTLHCPGRACVFRKILLHCCWVENSYVYHSMWTYVASLNEMENYANVYVVLDNTKPVYL